MPLKSAIPVDPNSRQVEAVLSPTGDDVALNADSASDLIVSATSGGQVAISSPPSALSAGDNLLSFSSTVRHLWVQNNSTVDVNVEIDAAASAGSYKVAASGGGLLADVVCNVLHVYSAGTPNLNGTGAGNLVVRGFA